MLISMVIDKDTIYSPHRFGNHDVKKCDIRVSGEGKDIVSVAFINERGPQTHSDLELPHAVARQLGLALLTAACKGFTGKIEWAVDEELLTTI